MKSIYLVLLVCFVPFFSGAQEDAWVFLTDKENVAASIANPSTILTQKSIDRKNKHGVLIDSRDVPVNENYITQIKSATGISVLAKSKWFNAVHVRGNQADIEALGNLSFVSNIDFANDNLNSDKSFKSKTINKLEGALTNFNYGNAANQIEMFNGNELHMLNYTASGITIAVLDSGFPNVNTIAAFQRMRDDGHLLGAYDFVNRDSDVYTGITSSHGTLVLSDMAGYIENQFVGTAPDASYYLFITEDAASETPVEESYWVEAAERADSLGVDIINTSLGYSDFDGTKYDYEQSDMNGNTTFITRGANIAFEKGLLLVTSAGNSGSWGVTAPADSPNVLSIGAVDASGDYVDFSSVGTMYQSVQKPDVVAQGGLSYVITENNNIARANGTSFSAPILAGGIACLWQALPNKTNAEIMQLVKESASQYSAPDNFLGHGIPDLQLALNTGLITNPGQRADFDVKLFPNPVNDLLYVSLNSEDDTATVRFYNILGKKINSFLVSTEHNEIDMSSFSSGIYLARIDTENISKTIKIIKQ
ncbi:T9SS type A sorting domain-containing protein [Hyunsoonleella flava]|uniref:T9SS type A sorting domain-containing protein n=1 Tax=Hyunsoonleella flava TaxID=2527939 RepID=A0A4Q9FFT4_9FLAO|nr:S8 family serine peptidase [Hyunsoonleella flava]TBN04896.1 T9SS type A sorting domain-containing protein [Hyunsoonleella flava]